jgi:hypothetical protein
LESERQRKEKALKIAWLKVATTIMKISKYMSANILFPRIFRGYIALFFLVAYAAAGGEAETQFKPALGGVFTGEISALGTVWAHLYEDKFKYDGFGRNSGAVMYIEYGEHQFDYLKSTHLDGCATFTNEVYGDDPKVLLTGCFQGDVFTGKATIGTNGEAAPFSLHRTYSELIFHPPDQSPRFHGDPPRFSFTARVPVLGNTPFAVAVDKNLRQSEIEQYQNDLKENAETWRERWSHWINKDRSCYFSRDVNWRLIYESENQISLSRWDYCYSGGAHGNLYITSRNFYLLNGQARPLYLEGFFKAPDWRNVLVNRLVADLNRQGASCPSPETVEDEVETDNCAFDASGIEFRFQPYEVGCYAEGVYRSRIAWADLRPLLYEWDGHGLPHNTNAPFQIDKPKGAITLGSMLIIHEVGDTDCTIQEVPAGESWRLAWCNHVEVEDLPKSCQIHLLGGPGVLSANKVLNIGEKGNVYVQIGARWASLWLAAGTKFKITGSAPDVIISRHHISQRF